jgi:hypothetical protein
VKKRRPEIYVRPETIRRLAEISGTTESQLRERLRSDANFTEGEPPDDDDDETVVVGSIRPILVGSRRETCSRCGGGCWLVDTPVPGASYLCARCYVRDEAPDMAWMIGPEVN